MPADGGQLLSNLGFEGRYDLGHFDPHWAMTIHSKLLGTADLPRFFHHSKRLGPPARDVLLGLRVGAERLASKEGA
jgi:hypothetical protein